MKLHNHSTISSTDDIAENEKRLILHNGLVVLGTIKKIISNDEVEVELLIDLSTSLSIRINKNSIYEQNTNG